MVYGIYAAGFFMRPLGAIVIGTIGDRFGRKKALEISILLMALPTLCIGLLPTYYQIGILAPILLTAMRLLQGISVGGELIGSYAFLIEHASEKRKKEAGSYGLIGCFGGKLLGSMVTLIIIHALSPAQVQSFGWRIAFIAGMGIAIFGFYIRRQLSETPVFLEMQKESSEKSLQLSSIFLGVGSLVLYTSSLQLLFVYLPVYLKNELSIDFAWATYSNVLSLALVMITMPFFARWADRLESNQFLLIGSILMGISIYPFFLILQTGNPYLIMGAQLFISVIFSFGYCCYPAYLMELFPPNVRCIGSAIAYNLGVSLFGGCTPIFCTWLIAYSKSPLVPAYWIVFTAFITTFAMIISDILKYKKLINCYFPWAGVLVNR